MQGGEQHIRAVIENILRPVAMVKVDIEDRDARGAMVAQVLCRNGRIVQEAVAAIQVTRSVVPRRAAQRKHAARTAAQFLRRAQRDVCRNVGRLPGAFADRGLAGHRVIPEFSGDRLWHALRHAPRRPAIRDRLAGGTRRQPVSPGVCEELDIGCVMHTN